MAQKWKAPGHQIPSLSVRFHLCEMTYMAGMAGLEPAECRSQSPVPYRLGYIPTFFLRKVNYKGHQAFCQGMRIRKVHTRIRKIVNANSKKRIIQKHKPHKKPMPYFPHSNSKEAKLALPGPVYVKYKLCAPSGILMLAEYSFHIFENSI